MGKRKNVFSFSKLFKGNRLGWVFVAPSLILFIITLGYPIYYAIRLSFFEVSLNFSETFVGLDNFITAFKDRWFWNSVKNTFIYTVSSVSITVLVGLLIALALSRPWLRCRAVFHLLFLVPWTLSYVVVGSVWRWILNASYGVINAILQLLHITEANISFLGSSEYALMSVIFVNTWRSIPFAVVMLYAGLQLIPTEQVEASKVDGATSLQTFWFVTLPHLRGVIAVTTVLSTIWTFIQFDLTQVLTLGGGPNHATELLSNLIYKTSFTYYEFGYGAAIAVLMLFIVLGMTILYQRLLEKDI